jgi:casein kinase 1
LGYLLLYFLRGKLPWQGIQIPNKTEKYAEIGRMKKQAKIDELCQHLGEGSSIIYFYVEALVKFFDYVKSMGFEQTPDYDYIRKIFKETLINRK